MSLSIEHVIALREVGIHADTFDEAREQLVNKFGVWGYVDYSFALERFYCVVQVKRKNQISYSQILSEIEYEYLDECQEDLMTELIKKAKEKANS